jgi:hypothetical protein
MDASARASSSNCPVTTHRTEQLPEPLILPARDHELSHRATQSHAVMAGAFLCLLSIQFLRGLAITLSQEGVGSELENCLKAGERLLSPRPQRRHEGSCGTNLA